MTKQNFLNVILGIGIVIVGFVAFTVKSTNTVIDKTVTNEVGAVVSSELSTNNFAFGEVRKWAYRPKFNVASSTLCAIKSPAATSTLVYAGYEIAVGTSTATTIDIAKGNTAYATTTLLLTGTAVASGAKANVSWTTAGASAADDIMAPSTWVIVKVATTDALGGYTFGGRCSAVFQEF